MHWTDSDLIIRHRQHAGAKREGEVMYAAGRAMQVRDAEARFAVGLERAAAAGAKARAKVGLRLLPCAVCAWGCFRGGIIPPHCSRSMQELSTALWCRQGGKERGSTARAEEVIKLLDGLSR